MDDIIPCIIVAFMSVLILFVRRDKVTPDEERFLALALAIHIASSIALPWFATTYLGGGDQLGYAFHGHELAEAMRRDFSGSAPEVLKLFFQREIDHLPYDGAGSTTGSMSAVTSLPMLIFGDSSYAAGMVFTLIALSGKWALYRVYRASFPAALRTRLMWATLLVPSVVCWSSGLVKEGLIFGPLGWTVYAVHSYNHGNRLYPLLISALSVVVIAFIKPYVLLPLSAGGIVWIYWHRATTGGGSGVPTGRPGYLILGLLLAALAVAGLGTIFPDYSVDTFAEHSAHYQDLGAQAGGGSLIELGDSSQRSLAGQLAYAPVALISSLFRPFIFEAKNPLMAIAALETTLLFVLAVRTIRARSWRNVWSTIWESPVLMFSTLFILLFGVAVGLTTVNLGTLSRYRLPMMPFYVALVVIVSKPQERSSETDAEDDTDTPDIDSARAAIRPS